MGNIAVDSFLTASFRSHARIKKLFDFGDRGNIGSEQLVINYDGQTNKGLLVDDHSSNSPNSAEVDGRVHLQAYTIPVEAAEISSGRVSAITMASKNVEGNSVRSLNVRGEASTVYSAAKLEDSSS